MIWAQRASGWSPCRTVLPMKEGNEVMNPLKAAQLISLQDLIL
jgi:hypothetical protein